MPAPAGHRLRIMGSPGSGKTAIGRAVAHATGLPLLSLDTLRHPVKSLPPKERHKRLREGLEEFLDRHDQWVIEGNQLDWARDTVGTATFGLVLSMPLRVRLWRCYFRWLEQRRRGTAPSFASYLRSQYYTAAWDYKWLPPLLAICDECRLPWTLCRTQPQIATALEERFPGAYERYQESVVPQLPVWTGMVLHPTGLDLCQDVVSLL